ncbi:hypothetical protein BGW42_006024, partial [Actinomortierella wolfii]
ASNVYFLVEWLPLRTSLGLFVGLTLTGVLCAGERVMTKALDQCSMDLYQWQEDQLLTLQQQAQDDDDFSHAATAITPRRRSRSNSGNGKLQSQDGTVLSPLPSSSSSNNTGSAGGLIHSSTSVTRLHRLQQRQMRVLLAKKTLLYLCVNALRLGYMLLAMSLHLGVLFVIVCSLTGTQLLLDCLSLRSSNQGSLEGYDRIGSSMELDHDFGQSSLRRMGHSDDDEDEDEDDDEINTNQTDIRPQQRREHKSKQQHRRRTQNTASMAVHLSRSNDCA